MGTHGILNGAVRLARRSALAVAFAAAALCGLPQTALAADAQPVGSIDILHVNDIHGRYEVDGVNAFAAVKGLADAEGVALTLDAGDTFHGASFATVSQGGSIAQLLDAAGFDATTPGNHDWSYGADRLLELDASGSFSVLAANVVDAETGEPYFAQPYLLKTVDLEGEDGEPTGERVQVGVLGVIDPGFYTSTPGKNVAGLSFTDPVAAANETAAALRAAGADIVICLTHNADPQALAADLVGVDAVIAGHEHLAIDEAVTAADGREVAVVECPSSPSADYFGSIGLLTLQIERADDGALSVSSHTDEQLATAQLTARDEGVAALTERIVADNAIILDQVVGTSAGDYPYGSAQGTEPGGWERVRTEDTEIGHLVTGSYLALTDADLAFENAGGIRGGVSAGDVTVGDLISISPYGNTLATYELTGAQVRATLEHSLDISKACRDVLARQIEAIENGGDPMAYSWPENSGSVIVVGGATMLVDWDRPAGERIRSIEVGGEPLEDARVYTVAMNSYLPGLTDEYPAFADMDLVAEWGTCEEALRALVAADGWEQLVDELTGTVSYADPDTGDPDAGDEDTPLVPLEPAEPVDGAGGAADDGAADDGVTAGDLPRTGDAGTLTVSVLAGLGALCAGAGAGLAWRRPARRARECDRERR